MKKTFVLDKPGKKEVVILFTKEGEEVELKGRILGKEEGEYIVDVLVDHKVGKTFGRVSIKGIAKNGARIKVTGMIKIDEEAQGVDDFLEVRILLLDEKSSATAEPKLEIEANEVKASHAAAVGRIDEEQMFYLESRGMSKEGAEGLIVDGFLK
jgi:Fe-S cluster assembly protein SufD